MPRERTLDERLRALERTVDAAAAPGRAWGERSGADDSTASYDPGGPADTDADGSGAPAEPANASLNGGERSSPGGAGDGVSKREAKRRSPEGPETGRGTGRRGASPSSGRQGDVEARLTDVEGRLSDVEDALAELQAGLQAVRGYVGRVDHVNESVERRANAAIAAVERLETASESQPNLATCPRPHEACGERSGIAMGDEQGDRESAHGPETPTAPGGAGNSSGIESDGSSSPSNPAPPNSSGPAGGPTQPNDEAGGEDGSGLRDRLKALV